MTEISNITIGESEQKLKEDAIDEILDEHPEPLEMNYVHIIKDVLSRLPLEALEFFAYNRVPLFYVIDKQVYATANNIKENRYAKKRDGAWCIFLNDSVMSQKTNVSNMHTVAHELAPVYLGHTLFNQSENIEIDANKLAEKWGFKESSTVY